jgi:hypothetical protein
LSILTEIIVTLSGRIVACVLSRKVFIGVYHQTNSFSSFHRRFDAALQSYSKGLEVAERFLGSKHAVCVTLRHSLLAAKKAASMQATNRRNKTTEGGGEARGEMTEAALTQANHRGENLNNSNTMFPAPQVNRSPPASSSSKLTRGNVETSLPDIYPNIPSQKGPATIGVTERTSSSVERKVLMLPKKKTITNSENKKKSLIKSPYNVSAT